ncbi:hypothetical protein [Acetobacter papayae]|uniref:hypothetical protein n=1 Tax=Acetobacter papayae TaxID=1076592 RepID=UPI0039E7D2EF
MKQNAPRTGHNPLPTPLLCCDHGRRLRRYATLLALLALAACGYNDSRRAHKGQLEVIGMTSEDLQACAGIPDKTARLDDHVQIFQYTRSINVPSTNDSTLFPLQTVVNLAQTSMGGAGKTCIASIRIVDGRVSDMHYSGDNDRMIGSDGVCATLVKGCLTTPPASAHSVSNNPIFGPVSAFHAPSLPTPGAKTVEPAVHYTNASAPQDTSAPLPPPSSEPLDAPANMASDVPTTTATPSNPAPLPPIVAVTSPATGSTSSSKEQPETVTKTTSDAATTTPTAPSAPIAASAAPSGTTAPVAGSVESSNQAAAIDPTNPGAAPDNTCPSTSAVAKPANGSASSPATPSEKAGGPCAAPLDHKS